MKTKKGAHTALFNFAYEKTFDLHFFFREKSKFLLSIMYKHSKIAVSNKIVDTNI